MCVGFFLALMGRMKSTSWTKQDSASFLSLGLNTPELERSVILLDLDTSVGVRKCRGR